MANILHGPFVPGAATSAGSYGTGVGQSNTYTSGNANNDETQAGVALHSFNPHMIGAGFVLSGAVCTKDGVNANQLDIASGEAYLIQSDGTPTLCDIAADNTHTTTGNPNTTMYLDLNPDGSWSWATAHSGVSGHLTIASVTTDASAHIAAVTDARPLSTTLLSGMAGDLAAPNALYIGGLSGGHLNVSSNALGVWTPQSGVARAIEFLSWNGAATQIPLSLGSTAVGAQSMINDTGAISQLAGQASAGSFGVPVIVAQAINVNITDTALHTICSFTPSANGVYRVSMVATLNNGTNGQKILLSVSYIDPNPSGTTVGSFFSGVAGNYNIYSGAGMTVTVNNQSIPTNPMIIYAKAGVNILVRYQDIGGTPNDFVSGMIERLS